ncbi:MAG: hypothetical protein NVS3B20_07420 [Polyangiales bacterium]
MTLKLASRQPQHLRKNRCRSNGGFGALFLVAAGCATLADKGEGDADLASALSGPFRSLHRNRSCTDVDGTCTGENELPPGVPSGIIKYPGRPHSRSPTVLVRDPSAAMNGDLRLVLYAARDLDSSTSSSIVRMEAFDARTFNDVAEVMRADLPYEGGSMSDPWAIQVGAEIWLYYAIAPTGKPGQVAGIARARSTDGTVGRSFAKDRAPVFTVSFADPSWE